MMPHVRDLPEGLSPRARSFLGAHAVRVEMSSLDEIRPRWRGIGIPEEQIDRVADYRARWGGLALPPAPFYDGGPLVLEGDVPEGSAEEGWWFDAGRQRTAVPYGFMIGPQGEFGIHAERWVPLHTGIEGWVESLALAYHAGMWAKQTTRVKGAEVDAISLDGFTAVPEVGGLTDGWWRGRDSLIAVYRGEAELFSAQPAAEALIYSGLSEWGLLGG